MACVAVISASHGQNFGYKYVTKHDGHYGHQDDFNNHGEWNGNDGGHGLGGHYQDYHV